ncbi:PREDICTED: dynein light chain roadblock-type 2 [Drosophila arizonae]|uniref:Dynein light chain roadblock-type 2 n=1 Tax=Drosophila arizonae TaxID=7263 RepID=A0ABM1PBY5_DROAR|nr:PREDICTED: dynein light chain roadblock-type 2 [Drosophila arizonae]
MIKGAPEKPRRTLHYVEEAFRQIEKKKNIRDIVIVNELGHPVKSTMEFKSSVKFVGLFQELQGRIERGMEHIDPTDEFLMLRVRTKLDEVLLVPDSKITMIVVQNADK